MPRPKKEAVVIPTTSLVASAVRYNGKAARIYQPNQNWQAEAYRHYAICGEARFAAQFFGHALSRASLGIATKGRDGLEPQESGPGVDALNALFNGADGQAQMLTALGIHLTIAGECYLVGRTVEGEDVWEIISIMELHVAGTKWSIAYGDGMQNVILEDTDVVIRIWMPNPARRIEADSPFRSLLPILTEIEWLTRHIFAQTSSRLAGAGILFLPQGMTFPSPPPVEGQPQVVGNEADGFSLVLGENMMVPITDPSSPAAMIPIVVTAPDESIDKAKLMHFWSELDAASLEMRSEAIRRFALGMDLPPEEILGMSSNGGTGGGASTGVSHWGAWQIEESTIKMHVEPKLELITNALTMGYLRPLTENPDEIIVSDTSSLRLRPDRSREAIELYNLGALSKATLLRENGFDPADEPDEAEFQEWLLRKVASGSATPEQVAAALKLLGVDLGPDTVDTPDTETREARPDPGLEQHPTRDLPSSSLLHASEALVFRALERAGNRLRSSGARPPGVPAYETHVYVQANGNSGFCLEDAWSSAPQVLAGLAPVESTVAILDSYCRTLLSEQSPHSRDRLAQWLTLGANA